jgi:hypothetical protein
VCPFGAGSCNAGALRRFDIVEIKRYNRQSRTLNHPPFLLLTSTTCLSFSSAFFLTSSLYYYFVASFFSSFCEFLSRLLCLIGEVFNIDITVKKNHMAEGSLYISSFFPLRELFPRSSMMRWGKNTRGISLAMASCDIIENGIHPIFAPEREFSGERKVRGENSSREVMRECAFRG